MKKIFTLLALAACCAAMTWGCSDDKYDDRVDGSASN